MSSTPKKLPSVGEVEEDVKQATKASFESLRSFVSGGVGGIFAVVVGHPFDLVKVRLQTAEKGVYSSAMDVVRKTVARDGAKVCLSSFSTLKFKLSLQEFFVPRVYTLVYQLL